MIINSVDHREGYKNAWKNDIAPAGIPTHNLLVRSLTLYKNVKETMTVAAAMESKYRFTWEVLS